MPLFTRSDPDELAYPNAALTSVWVASRASPLILSPAGGTSTTPPMSHLPLPLALLSG